MSNPFLPICFRNSPFLNIFESVNFISISNEENNNNHCPFFYYVRSCRPDGSVRSGAGHFPVNGPPAAKVPEDHASAAAPHGRIHPTAPGHLPESRPLRPRLCREVPRCLARHAGKEIFFFSRPFSFFPPRIKMRTPFFIH